MLDNKYLKHFKILYGLDWIFYCIALCFGVCSVTRLTDIYFLVAMLIIPAAILYFIGANAIFLVNSTDKESCAIEEDK